MDPTEPSPYDPRSGDAFGDRVRIQTTAATVEAGIAGRVGKVHGWSTPSLGYVSDVIGDPVNDVAIAVDFGDTEVWIVPDLVEFVDHGPGTTMAIGDSQFVRRDDGTWASIEGGSR